jgi:rhomboid protease GluP
MSGRGADSRLRLGPVLSAILILCISVEVILALGDVGVSGTGRLRATVFSLGSFRPELLHGADGVFPGQRVAMFLTYSVLHAGLAHLAVNMLTLLALGTSVLRRAGRWGFLEIYLAATLGGAVGYALIGAPDIPMVGASGALFGLAGALVGWDIADARTRRQSLWPALRLVLLLVVLNVVLWVAADGRVAWQAHLGGGVAGMLIALFRPAAPERSA